MSLWANIKFFPEPTGELYGWLLATLVIPCYYLLGKGGYVFGSVGLSVCLFVCEQHYSKSYERIGMKFYGRVLSSTNKI